MMPRAFAGGALLGVLFLVVNIPVSAQPNRVFGPPDRSQIQPPLWQNGGMRNRPGSTTGTGAPYTPQQVQAAYGFSPLYVTGTTGAGQTIALVDAYDDSQYIQSDLNAFDSEFGLAPATVQIIYAQGSKPAANSGWQQEISLDVEWAHAMAPGAKILLVEAADSSTTHLLQAVQVAVNNGATVVSMSWGGGESSIETSQDSYFTAPGVTYVASAGDSGAGVEWPAASPNVVGVGGTTLTLNSSGGYGSETAWSSSGGGISAYEKPQPVWQNGWFQTSWSPVNRGVPDVGYLANPNYGVYVVYKGTWYEFGGTSVGAPQWAALFALANQVRGSAASGADATIYSLANGGGVTSYGGYGVNPSYFNDVTSGSDGTAQDDSAFPGYDLVTGVGSPMAADLVPALAGTSAPPPTPDFALTVSPGSQTVNAGGATSYTVTVSPSGGYNGTVNLSVSGLPTGATGSFSAPSGSATLTMQTSSTTPAGAYTVTITGTDSTGSPTHSATATLVVVAPDFALAVSPSSQTVAPGAPASYTVTVSPSGGYNGTVNFSVSGLPNGASGTFTPSSGSAKLTVQTSSTTPVGTYPLTITGTDSTGSPTHSVNATLVVANTATTTTVSSISYSASKGFFSTLDITLTVLNNLGSPVRGATVSITLDLNGASYATGSGTTGANGQLTFALMNPPKGTYTTIVTAVTASGLTWNGSYPANSYSNH